MSRPVHDIVPALGFERVEQGAGAADATGEDRVFHDPGDLIFAALVGEIEVPATLLDTGHVLAKVSLAHGPLPTTERRENRPFVVTKINPVTVFNGLTDRAFDRNDFARPASPLASDLSRVGEAGEKMFRGYGEPKLFFARSDFETNNPAFHPTPDRLFHKNDGVIHWSTPRKLAGGNGCNALNANLTYVGNTANFNDMALS